MKKSVALLFGSFNPVHVGHLIIAETVAHSDGIDETWLVVSPQSPFKKKASMLNQYDRLHLAKLGAQDNHKIKASNIEFSLPLPSYTIDTLTYLHEKFPDYEFALVMGEDNLKHFHKWKNYEQILKHYRLIVYPRLGYKVALYQDHPKITRLEMPYLDISATQIRQLIKDGKSPRYLVTQAVYDYIQEMNLYR